MTDTVLPIETILFQLLFLLVAIALEARVFYKRLRIPRKTSVEYATSINLLTVTLGWLIFFSLQEWLPQALRTQMLSYIFFDRLLASQAQSLNLVIASVAIAVFFGAFAIKLKGLELLQAFLETAKPDQDSVLTKDRRLAFADRLNRALIHTDTNQAAVVLLANAYSHSAILLILFLRFLQLNSISG